MRWKALRRPRLIVILAALALPVLAVTTPACFSPRQPACAFSCAKAPHSCPSDYLCGDDGFCHREGVPPDGTCDQQPDEDAGPDAGPADGAVNNND
ncbi:MAG TPA: hypothetical protein VNO55_19005 [Polyangia bacterium]|nr:hypothetical protein [Polyangia bacterium]